MGGNAEKRGRSPSKDACNASAGAENETLKKAREEINEEEDLKTQPDVAEANESRGWANEDQAKAQNIKKSADVYRDEATKCKDAADAWVPGNTDMDYHMEYRGAADYYGMAQEEYTNAGDTYEAAADGYKYAIELYRSSGTEERDPAVEAAIEECGVSMEECRIAAMECRDAAQECEEDVRECMRASRRAHMNSFSDT